MSCSPPRTTGLRRPACLAALLTAVALTVTACGGEDAPTVVTVTAADGARLQSTTPDAGPVPTGANGEPLTGDSGSTGNSGNGGGASHPGTDPTPGSAPTPDRGSAPADTGGTGTASGQITLTGTVVDMTTSEIMDGRPSPNGEPESNGYIVLQLDGPQQVTAQKSGAAGQPGTETVSQISLATPTGGSLSPINWTGYVGQHVTVTTSVSGMWFPSDTGLPLGMVRLKEGTVQ